MVALMVPLLTPFSVPMVTGELKFPPASDNWAVKTLPELNEPLMVKGTENEAPVAADSQKGKPVIVPVEIVFG